MKGFPIEPSFGPSDELKWLTHVTIYKVVHDRASEQNAPTQFYHLCQFPSSNNPRFPLRSPDVSLTGTFSSSFVVWVPWLWCCLLWGKWMNTYSTLPLKIPDLSSPSHLSSYFPSQIFFSWTFLSGQPGKFSFLRKLQTPNTSWMLGQLELADCLQHILETSDITFLLGSAARLFCCPPPAWVPWHLLCVHTGPL